MNIENAHRPLRCTGDYRNFRMGGQVQKRYEYYCVCDEPECNKFMTVILGSSCHDGDYKLSDVEADTDFVTGLSNCYTNRNQCYIMKYTGKNTPSLN